ncbi:hypothetical protein ACFLT2_00020 [Acidobacteriota bacterium]
MRSLTFVFTVFCLAISFWGCKGTPSQADLEARDIESATGLEFEVISLEDIQKGKAPPGFRRKAKAEYKPSFNEDPAIPAQCWVETGYGTQNACQYCHTNYLAENRHGNALALAEDQILYSFPSPNLNRVNWKNIIHPEEILARLAEEELAVPRAGDPENLDYVRTDNWREAFRKARRNRDDSWNNLANTSSDFQLFPALNPDDLFPFVDEDKTSGGQHGFIDEDGFIWSKESQITGWRAINFFPYAIFTPLTGSVSGIYIRLSKEFMTEDGNPDLEIYKKNLDLLERNIKNLKIDSTHYYGDAKEVEVRKGFYPVGTEFAHPLHYVDLNADGDVGLRLDGLNRNEEPDYEFPGTRSKRVKEIRYMYKWKDVRLEDIGDDGEGDSAFLIGNKTRGWIDNSDGWILAAYIENREGDLRPQTTEELMQCLGCHSSVGNTIDAVWSFQRKLPREPGWGEMDYGRYNKRSPEKTWLQDYFKATENMGELEYFYFTVVGSDLFGVMPKEIMSELMEYAREYDLRERLELLHPLSDIFNDDQLKRWGKKGRQSILMDRARIMRHYASNRAYLYHDVASGDYYIKGNIFYPMPVTMLSNIAAYRRIVLDQSFNLGKNVFGTHSDAIPFTFRSDGTARDDKGNIIPVGDVIYVRPWGDDGVGITPTGIVGVDSSGNPVDETGAVVDIEKNPEKVVGHVTKGGTFETMYNPIITDNPVTKKK